MRMMRPVLESRRITTGVCFKAEWPFFGDRAGEPSGLEFLRLALARVFQSKVENQDVFRPFRRIKSAYSTNI
jgi:hypothetical protein